MPLKVRRADLQYPGAGWPPDEAQLVVMFGESPLGSFRRIDGGPMSSRWSWSITGVYVAPGIVTTHGTADSKEEAIAAFTRTLRTWLTHVGADELTDELLARYAFGSRRLKG